LFRFDSAEPTPFAHGELGLAEQLRDLGGAVPLLDGSLPEKLSESRVDFVEPPDYLIGNLIEADNKLFHEYLLFSCLEGPDLGSPGNTVPGGWHRDASPHAVRGFIGGCGRFGGNYCKARGGTRHVPDSPRRSRRFSELLVREASEPEGVVSALPRPG